jgi:hypothetical protein
MNWFKLEDKIINLTTIQVLCGDVNIGYIKFFNGANKYWCCYLRINGTIYEDKYYSYARNNTVQVSKKIKYKITYCDNIYIGWTNNRHRTIDTYVNHQKALKEVSRAYKYSKK